MGMNNRLLRPRNAFTPKSIAGLAAWYDASNASSITLNGTTVSQWNDLSGNARHQLQATAASQPNYSATGLNGRGTISTTGSQWMQADAFASSAAATVLLVWQINSNSGVPYVFQRGSVNDVHSFISNGGTANNQMAARRGSGNEGRVAVAELGNSGIWRIATLVFTTTLSRIFNGNTQGTDNTATVSAPTGNKVLFLFGLNSATLYASGLAEMCYYDRELNATQQQSVRDYLSRKWNVTL